MIVYANRKSWGRGIEIGVARRDGDALYHARPLEFARVQDGDYCEPTAVLSMDAAQKLMDELWACGIRPTEGSGSAGSLAATERHLDDMRQMAFKALKIDKP